MIFTGGGQQMRSLLAVHTSECRSLDISPDGKWLLTGFARVMRARGCVVSRAQFVSHPMLRSFDGTCALVAMRDLTHATPVARHADKIIRARWSPVESVFVTCSADRTVALWSLAA